MDSNRFLNPRQKPTSISSAIRLSLVSVSGFSNFFCLFLCWVMVNEGRFVRFWCSFFCLTAFVTQNMRLSDSIISWFLLLLSFTCSSLTTKSNKALISKMELLDTVHQTEGLQVFCVSLSCLNICSFCFVYVATETWLNLIFELES